MNYHTNEFTRKVSITDIRIAVNDDVANDTILGPLI